MQTEAWHSKREFETVFREHYSSLCAYAIGFVKEQETCEDIVQETFVKFWNNRNEIEIETSVKSYLYRAVRNACLNFIKHSNISNAFKQYNSEEISYSEQNQGDALATSELEQKIRNTIDLMPTERRKIFIMSRYEELKYKEIAERLDISIKTVENQMGKALAFLRNELTDFLPTIILIIYYFWNRG